MSLLQGGQSAERFVFLSIDDTLSRVEMLDLLVELRQMGMEVENNQVGLLTLSMSFAPFVKAVGTTLTAFFAQRSVEDLARLNDAIKDWFPSRAQNFQEFKEKLRASAFRWMRAAKAHPGAFAFASRHLLNVIKHWPAERTGVTPSEQLSASRKIIYRKLRRISKR